MAHPLLVNVVDLVRRPGSERQLSTSCTFAELDVTDQRFVATDEVRVELRLDSLSDGIVVDGTLVVPWHGTCRRCLNDAHGELECEVHELYQHTVTDPEAFEMQGDQLDLRPMVREVVLLDAPLTPVCRDDCAGLCPTCGVDRNEVTCDCTHIRTDPRWDALSDLHGQFPSSD